MADQGSSFTRWTLSAFWLAVCTLSPSASLAQQSLDQAFADGFSLLRFEPSPAGDRFFAVPEGAVPESDGGSGLRAHALGHYTLRPSLVRTDNVTGQDRELVSKQFFLHAGLSYVPTDWMHLHLDWPFALSQSGEGPNAPESPAVADPRVGVRFGLVGGEHSAFALAPGLDFWVPVGSQPNLVGDGAVRVTPRINISGEALPFAYSATLGYQVRKHVNTGSLEIGDSLVLGAAAGLVLFEEVLTVGPELHAAWLTESDADQAFASRTSPMEILFGARVRLSDFVLGAGVGPSLSDAPGVAPRAVFSLAYAPRTSGLQQEGPPPPADQDNDGVFDSEDACPDESGPSRPDPAKSGCPDERPVEPAATEATAAPAAETAAEPKPAIGPDADGDGITDSSDACPKQAGVGSADAEQNGCPAEPDRDGDGVPDKRDACPSEPGTKSADVKKSGCAEKVDTSQIKDSSEIIFSGYRSLPNGAGILFVEMTDPVAVEVKRAGRVLEYRLVGARVPLKNNRNPLLLREFSSSAVSAVLVPERARGRKGTSAVRLVVTLRSDANPSHRMVPRGKGAALEIELPPPK